MDAYELHEAKLIQRREGLSAANALSISLGPVPAGKVWTFLGALLRPSVAETQTVWWAIWDRLLNDVPITVPTSIALSAVIPYPLVTEGMEVKLYPGEHIAGNRAAATAGSTMFIRVRYIESDLPYYAYVEPLKKVILQKFKHAGAVRAAMGGGGGGEGGGGEGGGRERGGGGSEPI